MSFTKQAHQFSTRGPVLFDQITLFPKRIPDCIQILDVVGMLAGVQGGVPDIAFIAAEAAQFAFEAFVPQQFDTQALGLFLGNMFAVAVQLK